ncbi:DUF1205 domain-containing protein [Actinomadura sp. ATCC 31491]|uniref:DUF1205 domain-containing protein n=1 Tax=Actinomadura luzonensis TaxID=2805427 RepID=A0ABT0G934_9ACTN|nr:nucleotide disphospho-sugar-binding domain-containing protein [Actinomadura luzonensis]MCK2221107.1 DUF1205 domain-containing protein [Actinomadura luzonensis]
MRVLFTTFPSPSHFNPLVPLAWAFRTAGHEVTVASTPGLSAAILAAGLPAVAVGTDRSEEETWRDPGLSHWHNQGRWPDGWPQYPERLGPEQRELLAGLGRRQCANAEAMAGDLVAFARRWRAELVVHDAVSYAGPVAAAALGLPSVSNLWGAPGLQRLEMSDLLERPQPAYRRLFDPYGAPVRIWPTRWVDPCPPSMNHPSPVEPLPVRYVPYNGAPPQAPPEWVSTPPRGRPRVCVTWGATTGKFLGEAAAEPLRQAVLAAAGLAAEVVVATPEDQRELLLDLAGPRVRLAGRVPLDRLLPTCAAVVHHGGSGTTMTAAAAGVPQITVTGRPEPTLNGSRVADAGAGFNHTLDELPAGQDGVRLLREELGLLLEDGEHAKSAARLRAEIQAMPPPSELVPVLAALV